MTRRLLVADVGGTNARFALTLQGDSPGGSAGQLPTRSELQALQVVRAEDYADFAAALLAYLESLPSGQREVDAVHIAGAGPVVDQCIALTNSPWMIGGPHIAATVGAPVRLFNDLEAVGYALPALTSSEVSSLGAGGRQMPEGRSVEEAMDGRQRTQIAINIGTGFGAAVTVSVRGRTVAVLPTEAGHITFTARSSDEAILNGRVEAIEDVLSGAGVVRLYRLLGEHQPGNDIGISSAQALFERAQVGSDALSGKAVDLFTDLFGRIVGDLIVATGSWDGVYLCGSVVKGWTQVADIARFHARVIAKGKMTDRVRQVPLCCIAAAQPALIGLSSIRTETD
ncbi:MAG: ROK family protein [Pseudomonadota bacterium]